MQIAPENPPVARQGIGEAVSSNRPTNVEAEALATAMAAWRPPVDLAVLMPSAWLWFGGLGLALALAFAVANGIAGWVR